jgi:adenylosuccinate lyase
MRAIFEGKALVGRYVETEVALARAQARLDVVPHSAAIAIDEAGRWIAIDYEKLRRETEIVGYPILPLVHQLSAVRARPAGSCIGGHHAGYHGYRHSPAGPRGLGYRRA